MIRRPAPDSLSSSQRSDGARERYRMRAAGRAHPAGADRAGAGLCSRGNVAPRHLAAAVPPPTLATPHPRRLCRLRVGGYRICAAALTDRAPLARGSKPPWRTTPRPDRRLCLSHSPLPVLRGHRCAHPRPGRRRPPRPYRPYPAVPVPGMRDEGQRSLGYCARSAIQQGSKQKSSPTAAPSWNLRRGDGALAASLSRGPEADVARRNGDARQPGRP